MTENTDKSYSPEVISTYVWDAIKGLPGLADLHRSTLQSLGERVHFERMGPARIDEHEGRRVLDLHVVITPAARLPELVPQMRTAVRSYLHSMTASTSMPSRSTSTACPGTRRRARELRRPEPDQPRASAPGSRVVHVVAAAAGAPQAQSRADWEAAVEAEAGMLGRALLDGASRVRPVASSRVASRCQSSRCRRLPR